MPTKQYTFAANQYDNGWITSSRLFDTLAEAAEAAKQFLIVCAENDVPCDVRLIVHHQAES